MINPNRYSILHYKEQDQYAILSGWSGGYLDGDSWRRSSAIEKVEVTDTGYVVTTGSSIYQLDYRCNGLTGMSGSVWSQLDAAQKAIGKSMIELHTNEEEISDILLKFVAKPDTV